MKYNTVPESAILPSDMVLGVEDPGLNPAVPKARVSCLSVTVTNFR